MIRLKIQEVKDKRKEAFERRDDIAYEQYTREIHKLDQIKLELQDLLLLTGDTTPYWQCIRILLWHLPTEAL